MRQILPYIIFVILLATKSIAAATGCVECHGSMEKMKAAGFPHFTVTAREVAEQSGHRSASCHDCHMGNPAAQSREDAHRGMVSLLPVQKKGLSPSSGPRKTPLGYGINPANRLYISAMKDGKEIKDGTIATVQWHDKRRDNLAADFATLKNSCGRCHARQFEEFSRSAMGAVAKQSGYKGWTDSARGPHNCGPWFDGNFEVMQANSAIPIPKDAHALNQKVCNTCHTGCLDCHYDPQPGNPQNRALGSHTFVKSPTPMSCYGNGRANLCHAGPEDNRRGAGYYGGSFSVPEGNEPDIHQKAGIGCLDCHDSSANNKRLGHGVVKRQAGESCAKCHSDLVASHSLSIHKKLTCEACHIQRVAGYQGTYWGPGRLAGKETPFFKYKGYQGIMEQPILIKNQKGRWIPVKPFPMAAMNQKEAPWEPGLHWRYPADLPDLARTDDAWAFTGLHGGLPSNNKALTWIQMDKLSHKLGKARSCDSCHSDPSGSQVQKVKWSYEGPGAEPFSGNHTVTASATGLKISDIRSAEPIVPEKGYQLSALAPWKWLDVWEVSGDFSIPVPSDPAAYNRYKADMKLARTGRLIH